ncbi:MAG: fumarylacetoacetate hydrolase family protein [Marinifilaceae bacterium]
MKILCAEYNEKNELAIVPAGDDAILRENGDFYVPAFATQLSCVPQFIVKINRLGKFIGEKFASRYYNQIGVVVRFYADNLEAELAAQQLPTVMASTFMCSIVFNKVLPMEEGEIVNMRMYLNGELVNEVDTAHLPQSIDAFLARLSQFNMLKIGDYLLCGNNFRQRNLQINDHIELWLNDEKQLDFFIK